MHSAIPGDVDQSNADHCTTATTCKKAADLRCRSPRLHSFVGDRFPIFALALQRVVFGTCSMRLRHMTRGRAPNFRVSEFDRPFYQKFFYGFLYKKFS